ncbi:CHAT domain-containing protein [Actinoplanes sp. NBC_00393]|uniref:CHAT domain-containing protein n=1 Tax=Actinoplanes sp. NBC_00393 TaxID=2975953 RepID=UPI002E217895
MEDSMLDRIRAARRDLDEVIEEIRRVDGYEQFLAAPTFDDVEEAAADQPLVYLAAADLGGLALVVRGDDVAHVPLPKLTEQSLHSMVDDFHQGYAAFRADRPAQLAAWNSTLDRTTRWLWDEVMGPVLDELRPAPAAVLVAGGLLGLLPLHAAWYEDSSATTGRRYALDELTLSYTPNARSLTAARELAGGPADRLLAVVDPSASLPSVTAEARVAALALPAGPTALTGPAATVEQVRDALQHVDVAHFACHGYANLLTPLESGINLAGGQALTLRDLLSLSLRLRLVVLSACETSTPGTELPDEVVSLPTGMLQAGVGGIVASLWQVPDRPTLALMTEFYRRWRKDEPVPAAALRQAQQWVRDTTNEQKLQAYDDARAAGSLPDDVADGLSEDLLLEEPEERSDAGLDAWAAFGFVGA